MESRVTYADDTWIYRTARIRPGHAHGILYGAFTNRTGGRLEKFLPWPPEMEVTCGHYAPLIYQREKAILRGAGTSNDKTLGELFPGIWTNGVVFYERTTPP